jgi:hypothetical protein
MNMQQPFSVEGARLIADARDNKDSSVMHSSLLMLEIQANALEQERRNKQLMNDQLRLARYERRNAVGNALMIIRHNVGSILISVGERLRPEPAPRPDRAKTVMKA